MQILPSASSWIKQFSTFVLGGILTALVDVGATALLLTLGVWYVTSISIGFLFGLGVNFIYHTKITFSVNLSKKIALKYLAITAVNYLLTLMIVFFVHHLCGGSVMLGKILSLPIVAALGYLMSKFWVFTAS